MILLSSFARNSVRLVLLFPLNLCEIRVGGRIYAAQLSLLGIDCAYLICPPVRFMISGSAPKFIRIAPLAFAEYDSDCQLQAEQFQDGVFQFLSWFSGFHFMILRQVSVEYKMLSTTECRFQRMESAASHRLWTLTGILWRTRSVIINNVWRSWYFEYFLP